MPVIHGFEAGTVVRVGPSAYPGWSGIVGIVEPRLRGSFDDSGIDYWRSTPYLPLLVLRKSDTGYGGSGGFYPNGCTPLDPQPPRYGRSGLFIAGDLVRGRPGESVAGRLGVVGETRFEGDLVPVRWLDGQREQAYFSYRLEPACPFRIEQLGRLSRS